MQHSGAARYANRMSIAQRTVFSKHPATRQRLTKPVLGDPKPPGGTEPQRVTHLHHTTGRTADQSEAHRPKFVVNRHGSCAQEGEKGVVVLGGSCKCCPV